MAEHEHEHDSVDNNVAGQQKLLSDQAQHNQNPTTNSSVEQGQDEQPTQVRHEDTNIVSPIAGSASRIKQEEDGNNKATHASRYSDTPIEVIDLEQDDAITENPNSDESAGENLQSDNPTNPGHNAPQSGAPPEPTDNTEDNADEHGGESAQAEHPADQSNLANESQHTDDNSAIQATAPNLGQPTNSPSSDLVSSKDSRLLFNEIKGKLSDAKGLEQSFFVHLKHYMVTLLSSKSRLFVSDINEIKGFMHDFQSFKNKLDDKQNDNYDIYAYEGLIMGLSNDCKAKIAGTNPKPEESASEFVGTKASAALFTDIKASLSNMRRKSDRAFYNHLRQYVGKNLKIHKGWLFCADVDKVKEFIEEFKAFMHDLDDRYNDYQDICAYEGMIKGVIAECEEELPLPKQM